MKYRGLISTKPLHQNSLAIPLYRAQSLFLALRALVLPGVNFFMVHYQNFRHSELHCREPRVSMVALICTCQQSLCITETVWDGMETMSSKVVRNHRGKQHIKHTLIQGKWCNFGAWLCHTYDWICYLKLPFCVCGQVRKQGWEVMS